MVPVHPFLNEIEVDRLARFQGADIPVIAIQTSGDCPPPIRFPARPASIYKVAKAIRARQLGDLGRGQVSFGEGLETACNRPEVGCAIFTTSQVKHLHDNLRAVQTS